MPWTHTVDWVVPKKCEPPNCLACTPLARVIFKVAQRCEFLLSSAAQAMTMRIKATDKCHAVLMQLCPLHH